VELGSDQSGEHWLRARRDVDTAIDLWDAQRIGVGPATELTLA
jgi:2-phospho-L-lactate guanylyltransferase (CobY/MobA/RfbA family)